MSSFPVPSLRVARDVSCTSDPSFHALEGAWVPLGWQGLEGGVYSHRDLSFLVRVPS